MPCNPLPAVATGTTGAAQCSGRGACVSSSAFPETAAWGNATNNAFVCLCDADFTGGADFFDARVVPNGVVTPDGSRREAALDCATPKALPIVVFSIVLIVALLRWLATVVAFIIVVRQTRQKSRRRLRALCDRSATRVLMLEGFLFTPLLIAAMCVRVSGDGSRVFGTDAVCTSMYAIAVTAQAATWFDNSFHSVVGLLRAGEMNSRVVRKLLPLYRAGPLIILFLYLVGQSGTMIAMTIIVDPTGPLRNGEYGLLIGRNVSHVIIGVTISVHASLILRETRKVLADLAPSGAQVSASSPAMGNATTLGGASSSAPTAAVRVLQSLERSVQEFRVAMFVGFVIMTAGCLPWMWPYQAPVAAFTVSLAQIKTSSGMDVLRAQRAAAKANQGGVVMMGSGRDLAVATGAAAAPAPAPGGGAAPPEASDVSGLN